MGTNNQLVGVQQDVAVTMTSLEIVEFINTERKNIADSGGKKFVELLHKSFLTKVVAVLGEKASAKFFAHVSLGVGNGAVRQSPAYKFPKREATLMAMSYSSATSAAVYDRMTALEGELVKRTSHTIPQTLAAALRLAAEQAEAVEVLKLEVDTQNTLIATQAPKVEFHDAVASAENCHDMGEAAKILGKSRNKLFKYLRDIGMLQSSDEQWNVPYQKSLNAGHFKVVETEFKDHRTLVTHISSKTLVTGKGMIYLSKKLKGVRM